MNKRIAMIGAGNMAQALIGGLLRQGHPVEKVMAADPNATIRKQVRASFGIQVASDNASATQRADIIILAVKPQVIDRVITSLQDAVPVNAVIISIAAGITVTHLKSSFHAGQAIVRAMPNTPALFGLGATGVFADEDCDDEQRQQAREIFEAVGQVAMIQNEQLMDAVTAVSGSGPAYFFALAEALHEAGIAAGLSDSTAGLLARQTAAGAGAMLGQAGADAVLLRKKVTSPGGTTAAALDSMNSANFKNIIANAVQAAIHRGQALGQTGSGDDA